MLTSVHRVWVQLHSRRIGKIKVWSPFNHLHAAQTWLAVQRRLSNQVRRRALLDFLELLSVL